MTIHTKFQDYHVHHCKKLCDLQFNLEKVVSEFGAGCLPYPGKNSTISNIIGWFDNELKALSATIVKANKNFVCYAIVAILRMLYHNSCEHIEVLQSIMALCDLSILEDLPEELTKLTGHLVKKRWAAVNYGFVQSLNLGGSTGGTDKAYMSPREEVVIRTWPTQCCESSLKETGGDHVLRMLCCFMFCVDIH
jgi:hypothetical protein